MMMLSFVISGLALLLALLVARGVFSEAVGDHEVVLVFVTDASHAPSVFYRPRCSRQQRFLHDLPASAASMPAASLNTSLPISIRTQAMLPVKRPCGVS
jgi:hypothetical protein